MELACVSIYFYFSPPWYNWNIVESGVKHHNPIYFSIVWNPGDIAIAFKISYWNQSSRNCQSCQIWPAKFGKILIRTDCHWHKIGILL